MPCGDAGGMDNCVQDDALTGANVRVGRSEDTVPEVRCISVPPFLLKGGRGDFDSLVLDKPLKSPSIPPLEKGEDKLSPMLFPEAFLKCVTASKQCPPDWWALWCPKA